MTRFAILGSGKALRFLGGCLAVSLLVGCGVPRATGSRGVAFGTASGVESSGRPFTVLRFTPGGPEAVVSGSAVARHPSGDVVIAGFFVDTANVGLGPASLGGTAAFVGRYAPSGTPRWVRWVRSAGGSPPKVAVNGQGEVFLAGETQHAPRPFGEPDPAACTDKPTCTVGPALHALGEDGEVRWSRALPRDARERMMPELVDATSGDVTIAGRFGSNGTDAFVARYDHESGERRWFTRVRETTATNLAVTREGETFLTGASHRDVHVDDVHLATGGATVSHLLRLRAKDGVAAWAKVMVPNVATGILAIAPDGRGDLFVVRCTAQNHAKLAVETLSAASGTTLRSAMLPVPEGNATAAAIQAAPDGSPIVSVTRTLGEAPRTTVMGFTPTLAPTWQKELRSAASGTGKPASRVETASLAALSATEAVVAGSFTGRVELGGNLAEAPWAPEKRRCPTLDDDEDDCTHDWAARAMFVARIKR